MPSSPQYEGQLKGLVTKVEAWDSKNVPGPRGNRHRTDHPQRSTAVAEVVNLTSLGHIGGTLDHIQTSGF